MYENYSSDSHAQIRLTGRISWVIQRVGLVLSLKRTIHWKRPAERVVARQLATSKIYDQSSSHWPGQFVYHYGLWCVTKRSTWGSTKPTCGYALLMIVVASFTNAATNMKLRIILKLNHWSSTAPAALSLAQRLESTKLPQIICKIKLARPPGNRSTWGWSELCI